MLNTDMGLMWNFQVNIFEAKINFNSSFQQSQVSKKTGRPWQSGRASDGSLLCSGISDKSWKKSKTRSESGVVKCHAEAKAKTAGVVEEFARDQAVWAAEFGSVFEKMLGNGNSGVLTTSSNYQCCTRLHPTTDWAGPCDQQDLC